MRVTYNAPVVLTFTLAAVLLMFVGSLTGNAVTHRFFAVYPGMSWTNPVDYWRLLSHVLGHDNWGHLIGNLTFILLLGPALEEKYGSVRLLKMMVLTAAATGLATVCFFSTGLLGASGIVFMFIILGSYVNARNGDIPLTFVLVASLFLGKEVLAALGSDSISQMAHLVGGACGSLFGFSRMKS